MQTSNVPSEVRHSRPTTTERRTRRRLRELCDEVLASYRVARERDLFSAEERDQARALMARVVTRG